MNKSYQYLIYPEFRFSRTAYIYFLMQMQEYEMAMRQYRTYYSDLSKLGEYTRYCIECVAGEYPSRQEYILDDDYSPAQIPYRKDKLIQYYQDQQNMDLRARIKRSNTFFLERQLSWLGKTYDRRCWVNAPDIEEYAVSLIDLLETWSQKDYFLPIEEFIRPCYDLLPKDLEVLQNDIRKKDYLPKINKLNKCFKELGLPYWLDKKQLTHQGERKTHWKVVKKPPVE